MPIVEKDGQPVWRRRDRAAALRIWAAWLVCTAAVVTAWGFVSGQTMWAFVIDAPAQAADVFGRMIPPRFEVLPSLLRPMWDTINIATLGTLLGVVIAVPTAFLTARNTAPHPIVARYSGLVILVSSRSINSLIWALLLVAILGPGMIAGVLAIALRSVGFVGKLLYESIEEIDGKQVEAVVATGAGSAQILSYGVVPQILPAFAGITVYRWDINIRESTVLGLVGAGGIGMQLQAAIDMLAWPQVAVIFLLILSTVVASEWVSAKVRGTIL
jgi:phosphonate transport system permease protein